MRDKCTSEDCGNALIPGEQIIQLASGDYMQGYITPSLVPDDTHNWHPGCFHEYPQDKQAAPYSCVRCNRQLVDGDRVLYACSGEMPNRGYIRAEKRGYFILYIAHIVCA